MKLKNVRLKVDEKTFLPQYAGEFAFNIEVAQDLSSMFNDETETHRVVGKLFCDEVKRIKDENLLNVIEYEKSLLQQIRELEWVLMLEPKSPLGFTKHMQEYCHELLDIFEPIIIKKKCPDECTDYELQVIKRFLSIADMKRYGLGFRMTIQE